MQEPSARPSSGSKRGRWTRLSRPAKGLVSASSLVLTIAGVIIAGRALALQVDSNDLSSEGNSIMREQLEVARQDNASWRGSQPPSPPSAGTSEAAQVRGGSADCLHGANTVSCHRDHDGEVLAVDPCTIDSLTAYLGGRPGMDVLRPDLVVGPELGFTCVARFPFLLDRQASGALEDDDGSAWRWCRNSRSGADVSCIEPHDEEVVALQAADSLQELDCVDEAGEYMSVVWERVQSELDVYEEQLDGARICVVAPRGANSLEGTLKDLGTNSLPLGQAL